MRNRGCVIISHEATSSQGHSWPISRQARRLRRVHSGKCRFASLVHEASLLGFSLDQWLKPGPRSLVNEAVELNGGFPFPRRERRDWQEQAW